MRDLYIPDASQWIGALEAGQQAGMTRRRDQATQRAGSLMTSGDYRGAAAEIAPYDLRSGLAIKQMGTEQEDATRRAGYGAKVAAGKGAEAVSEATASGEFKLATDLQTALDAADDHKKKVVHDHATRVAEIVAPLGDIPETDMAARKAYIVQHRPDLLAAGYTEEQVDNFQPTNANLAPIYTEALGLKDYLERTAPKVVGSALVRTPVGGGKPEVLYENESYQIVPEGGKAIPKRGRVMGDAAPAAGASPAEEAPTPTGGIFGQIGQIATTKGAQPGEVSYLQRLAQVESHGDPNAQNGSSTGVFQFHPDTFASVGGSNIHDVGDQTAAALALSRRDRAKLQAMGVEPTDANVYIMHQQGPGGGPALLSAPPEVSAVQALAPVYGGNAALATKAITGNGGTAEMTAGQFVDMWRQRWASGGRPTAAAAQGRPASAQAGDPAGTVYGNPKPVKAPPRPATAAEKAQYGVGADVPAQMVDGELKVITGTGAALKPVPAPIQKQLIDARSGLKKVDYALDMVAKHGKAFGMGNIVGDAVTQRLPGEMGKEGIAARAAVANIGSMIIHDRSGAAVTIAETPRLKPFIPMPTDTPDAVATKLRGLRNEMAIMASEIEETYGEDSGYRPMGGSTPGPVPSGPAAAPRAAQAPAAKPAAPKAAHQMSDAEIKAALGLY